MSQSTETESSIGDALRIRLAALTAPVAASTADDGTALTMAHLQAAALALYERLGRPLTPGDRWW